jgi:hypothetical protein
MISPGFTGHATDTAFLRKFEKVSSAWQRHRARGGQRRVSAQ